MIERSLILLLSTLETCTWLEGDAKGDSETFVGFTSTADECAVQVRSSQPTANGATWEETDNGNGWHSGQPNECAAEFGATWICTPGISGCNADTAKWRTCALKGQLLYFTGKCIH